MWEKEKTQLNLHNSQMMHYDKKKDNVSKCKMTRKTLNKQL